MMDRYPFATRYAPPELHSETEARWLRDENRKLKEQIREIRKQLLEILEKTQ